MLLAPSGKGRKRQKKGDFGRFRPISKKGGQTPLKPPFVTPPFAAAQELLRQTKPQEGRFASGFATKGCFCDFRPEKWGHSQVGFRGSNASGGRIVLLPAAFWAHVLPKWPLWAHLFYSVFYSVSELGRACFRQAHVARAVLPPNKMFRARAFALPPCAPKSHMCPVPHLGASDFVTLECFLPGRTRRIDKNR